MLYTYFGTIVASAIIFLFMGILLFLQRKNGGLSRMMLSFITLISVCNYISRIVNFHQTPSSFEVMPIRLLLLGIFVISTYIMYPIEVISPGWLNWKRVLKIYFPLVVVWGIYRLTLWFGVEYLKFSTFSELQSNIFSFGVIYRIILVVLIFTPAMFLWYLPYTRKYNNTDHRWMAGYTAAVMINTVAYLLVIAHNSIEVRSLYYIVSVSCSFYIFYQELFVRLIKISEENVVLSQVKVKTEPMTDLFCDQSLYMKIEAYMRNEQAWRDPDLSMTMLVEKLCTNRRALLAALHQGGYNGYPSYINSKRIGDFISLINSREITSYQNAFFEVGFRSKSTAFRNFKDFTGLTPSEYFDKKG